MIYDAEHFFDGYRDDPGYALECLRAAAEAGAENVALCDTNGSQPAARRSPRRPRRSSTALGDVARRHPHATTTRECGVANSLAAVEAGATHGAGHDQRLRRAHAATPTCLDPRRPAAQDGLRRASADEQLARLTETAHFVDELSTHAGPRPALRRPQRLRPQGRHARRRRRAPTPRTFEHIDPALVGNEREMLVSELSGKGTVLEQRRARPGIELDDEAAARVVERVKEREHRGYHYEAADASFELLLRRRPATTSRSSGSSASA